MKLHLVKPSIGRVFYSILVVAILGCLLTGIALAIGYTLGYNESDPAPAGEYLRLVVTSVVLWGPILLLTAWWVSIPAVLVIGILAASIRRRPTP